MPQPAARLRLARFQCQIAKALAALHKEIIQREHELAALKAEAARWQRMLRRGLARRSVVVLGRTQKGGRRVDWAAVLARLPKTFTAKDIAQQAGKSIAQVYTPVSRWIKERKIRRAKDGYQKVSRLS